MVKTGNESGQTQAEVPLATFEFEREVRMADTDATGFAQFGCYIRMMEETEYAFLRSRGLRVVLYDQRGTMGFPRLHTQAKVHKPLTFGQCVMVRLQVVSIDGKQIEYRFQIFDDHEEVAGGRFNVAFCRFPDHQAPYAILIPEEVIAALKNSEGLTQHSQNNLSTTPCL